MKIRKLIFVSLIALAFFSCSDSNKNKLTTQGIISGSEMKKGAQIYRAKCMICHRKNGEGLKNVYPPLANSDFLEKKTEDAIRMVKYGSGEEIKVNGVKYKSYMPASGLKEKELSLVFNYILNSWGNAYGRIETETVKNIKEKK